MRRDRPKDNEDLMSENTRSVKMACSHTIEGELNYVDCSRQENARKRTSAASVDATAAGDTSVQNAYPTTTVHISAIRMHQRNHAPIMVAKAVERAKANDRRGSPSTMRIHHRK